LKKVLKIASLSALLISSLYAGDGNRSGFYFGGGVGKTSYSDDGLSRAISGNEIKSNNDDSNLKGYVGWQFNNVIGIELGYTDYGTFLSENPYNLYTYNVQSYSVAANLGYSFLNSQLRPFVNIGLAYLSTKHENASPYLQDLTDDQNLGLHYGIGFQVEPNILYGLGFRIAYEADIYATQLIYSNSDDTYTQGNNILYMGVQYKF